MNQTLEKGAQPLSGWVRLYHPAGVQVTLPLPLEGTLSAAQAAQLLESVSALLSGGWLVELENQAEGETREAVTHLVRRVKVNEDESETPLLDVYTGGNYRTVSVYLNTQEDRNALMDCLGYPVERLPLYEGSTPIERQKNPNRDRQYVVAVSGLAVVWKPNPRYSGADDKRHAKRVFVRWLRCGETQAPANVRRYLDGTTVNGNQAEQQAFDAHLSTFGRAPGNKEQLRAWAMAPRAVS